EVIGIAGLVGAGRTELAYSIFGNPRGYKIQGDMFVNGQKVSFKSPKEAMDAGIAYVTEDRKGEGLVLNQDIKQNITLANLRKIANRGIVNQHEEINIGNYYKDTFNIKAYGIDQVTGNLSGGNQQKVSISKWLFTEPKILILDEPTRGIDVGAKFEIYTIINQLIAEGLTIIIISSELPEILGMSDRIYVISEGKQTGELKIEEATADKVMELAVK
ncbi:MAG: ATP-binding cassette domain-containing protein, partial [Defluviitaleaceae bacterium]|nr:ATP-binding cassette domain-containing protein [Defluviitaleaceae bacterium]